MNSYELSRAFFDWSFENPEKITPTHVAMYFFIIEHCNRLGWKEKFGLPTTMVKEAIGIKNFRTYTNTLNELVEWGFIIMIEKSKNQYSSNIIAIAKNTIARAKAPTKAPTKALDKALQKHHTKHCKSIDSIDKQVTINKEQETRENTPESRAQISSTHLNEFQKISIDDCRKKYDVENVNLRNDLGAYLHIKPDEVIILHNNFDLMLKTKEPEKQYNDYTRHFSNWARKLSPEKLQKNIKPVTATNINRIVHYS